MHLHSLHHVSFEGLGRIADWADCRGWTRSATWQHRGDPLPNLEDVDLLCIMGGPMSVGDEHLFPWLAPEKVLIQEALARNIPTIGVCLGAQLIADVSGAPVAQMPHKEIGWYDIWKLEVACPLSWMRTFPDTLKVLHWHGDQFAIPPGATPLWSSAACPNQGFALGSALALQFHLELSRENLALLVDHAGDELISESPSVQTDDEILAAVHPFVQTADVLYRLLDDWLKTL
ncbi:MAG: type 1 glutamine amidotransferase [Verrucomicrobia bacterium]|nr:type 1 glutamine amidotransferase [Verrucomicrobiota bacterium]MCH8526815.1 type 1 glutamine amidotransferase [Kiritimatiellia bacterium]